MPRTHPPLLRGFTYASALVIGTCEYMISSWYNKQCN